MRDFSAIDPLPMKLGAKSGDPEYRTAEVAHLLRDLEADVPRHKRLPSFREVERQKAEEKAVREQIQKDSEMRHAGYRRVVFDKRIADFNGKHEVQLAPAIWPSPTQPVKAGFTPNPAVWLNGSDLVSFGPTTIEYEGPTNGALRPGEWIEWKGGDCPVSHGTKYQVRLRDGETHTSYVDSSDFKLLGGIWTHTGDDDDIVAFRVIA